MGKLKVIFLNLLSALVLLNTIIMFNEFTFNGLLINILAYIYIYREVKEYLKNIGYYNEKDMEDELKESHIYFKDEKNKSHNYFQCKCRKQK